ncbi:transglutaminase family protein [Aeromicrobium panaciterrae]|uniref:transglutaminase-like domain-containing protein n=1 Tax=Aeromicrobium panaciterrae TaxID=363861 RepID=UPI0031DF1C8C
MKRSVSVRLELELHDPADLIFSIAVAQGAELEAESFTISSANGELEARELIGRHGTRLHRLTGPTGKMTIDYSAVATGHAQPAPVDELDLIGYRRPSRYCESDTLFSTAQAEFAGVSGKELLDAVTSWVTSHLSYVPGSSLHTDGAVATMLAREGVCRDYAHLVVALLRGLDVPARLASVYAPGLYPMDFHAVAEAYIEDAWHVVDATALAPRQSLLRIATGQDAAETAFLSQYGARVDLLSMQVMAVADVLPRDDTTQLAQLV